MRFTFRAHERLKRPQDFLRARRQGRRRAGRFLVLWAYDRAESPRRAARLGVQVGRKDGIAVRRNRFKRRVRDIFRLHKHELARGWDVVVATRREAVRPPDFPAERSVLENDFLNAARSLGLMSPAPGRPAPGATG
jgi:ribonuclease P protein component